MLKSILKTSSYFALMVWSGMVCATGLGGINVSSFLGQPLKAEIDLVSVDKSDKSSISARLASAEAFKNAGIEYPYALPKLKFEVISRDGGDPYVKLTSSQPVNEPFVTLLVEVTWSSGKLLREYTFLLDPADFKAQEPKAEAIKPIEPVVVMPAAPVAPPAPAIPVAAAPVVPAPVSPAVTPPAPIARAPVPQAQPQTLTPQPTAAPALAPAASLEPAPLETAAVPQQAAPAPATEPSKSSEDLSVEEMMADTEGTTEPITVMRGDTLGKIALKTKPAEVSLERMLVALYRANSDAFVASNMNRLQTGKIIRVPDASELEAVQQSEAVKEVRAQVADWNAYRQQLAAARVESGEQGSRQESSGKVNAAVAEKAATGKEAAKEVLKLSKGEAPTDKQVAAGKATAQEKANAKEEEAIAKSKALKEAQERTALLEKNVKDLQRLAELKKQSAAAQASSAAAATAVVAAPKPAASAPAAAEPEVAVEASLVDELLADPIMLAGVVAALFALGGVGYVFARRAKSAAGKDAKQESEDMEEVGGATGRIAAPVMPSPDTGDFTQAAGAETSVQSAEDEVDPIGEADLFLTFGRDAQAEEVLKEALKINPGNIPVKLKLLSIYVTRKDTNSFFTYAREIKESGDEAAWNQAAAMGREIEPSNPLYGGGGAAEAAPEQHADTPAPSVDFDLGFGSTTTEIPAPAFQNTMVMEAPTHESTTVLSASELRAAQEAPMDFDITGTQTTPAAGEASAPSINLDEMVFDVTTTHPGLSAAAGGAKESAETGLEDMVFDITTSHPDAPAFGKKADESSESNEGGLGDLVFDITSSHPAFTEAAAATTAAPTPAAEETMAFTLDFPTDFKSEPAAKAETPLDIGLGGIDLNLDNLMAPAPAANAEVKDEHWQEVATKLDLAKAYQEMGDAAGAKEILDEVLRDGDEQQRATAQDMLQQL